MATSTRLYAMDSALLLSAETTADARTWDALVNTAHMPDVYYRPGYARSYQEIGHGRAVAFVVEIPGVRALFPLLLRPLGTLPFAHGERGLDAATPYGYGGVVLLDGLEHLDPEQGRALLSQLRACCKDAGIISAYLRLQPVTHQADWFPRTSDKDLELIFHAPTTAINVSCWPSAAEVGATLKKCRRTDLNLARRHLHLTWTCEGRNHNRDLKIFFDLYERRMVELGAGSYYHFPFKYYDALGHGLGEGLEVGIAWLGEEPVGAALFLIDGAIAHYHLSATNDLGRKLAATTLILDGAARRARERHCEYLHLGGGSNGEDQLFAFKKSFGGLTYPYTSLGLVCDQVLHRELVDRRVRTPALPPVRPRFFPEYRA